MIRHLAQARHLLGDAQRRLRAQRNPLASLAAAQLEVTELALDEVFAQVHRWAKVLTMVPEDEPEAGDT